MRNYANVLYLSIVVIELFICANALPVPSAETFDFMRKYGYIPDDGDNSAALFTEDGLENVIKKIQLFGGLPQTGKLNNETLALMKQPRCGVPDVIRETKRAKRFVLGPKGWNKRDLTFYIANWSSKLSEEIVAKYISKGLEEWGRYARLHFKRVWSPEADIIVTFGRGYHGDSYPFDGPGNILAHAFFPYEYANLGGDIHFDDDENWTTETDEIKGTDFYQVAIHELGHSLGLSHSPVSSSVMFPYYTGRFPENLDYDDILGMYELYIKRRLDSDDRPPSTTEDPRWSTTTSPQSSTTETYEEEGSGWRSTTSRPVTRRTLSTSFTTTISYGGDWESVDDHLTHDPTSKFPTRATTSRWSTYTPPTRSSHYTTSSPRPKPATPDICSGHYDAVATLRNELFVFKGEHLWRLRKEYDIIPGYPIRFRQMFPLLPADVRRIDAAYQRPDGNIILFSGAHYWVYDGTFFVEGSPLPLTAIGLPDTLQAVDAVQNWARNGKTYFYRGNMFWRYDEQRRRMDDGYPMRMDRWRGVPAHLDAATTWKGITYFFKGHCYWKFDNEWIVATKTSPLPAPQTWFGCPKEETEYCVSNNVYPWE